MRGTRYKNGFSLIEVLIALVLIGLAIASLVVANSSFTQANAAGTHLSTAEFLIEQIRELTIPLPVVDPNTGISTFGLETGETTVADCDDLDDFDGASFCPPISAERVTLNDLASFTQDITVENVSAGDFEQVVGNHGSYFVRVTVIVSLGSNEISSSSWIRAWYDQ
jgi:prepilin-type N-terminal cleavage/methylation domain-containing protein